MGLLITALLLVPQIMQYAVVNTPSPSTSSPTPGLVNFSGMPSSETNALGTQSYSATSKCPTLTYCAPVADPTSSGSTLLVVYSYKAAAGADVPTVTGYTGNGVGGVFVGGGVKMSNVVSQ